MNKITFEAFEGIDKVTPKVFYKYNLKRKGNIENLNHLKIFLKKTSLI